MNRTATRFVSFGAGVLALVILGWILTGNAKPGEEDMPYHTGVPTDWSHSHLIFSRPRSADQARELGRDPRYWQQLYRRELQRTLRADPGNDISGQVDEAVQHARSGGLWSENLGANAAPGSGNYPANYSFSLSTANCGSATTPDFVVYSTGLTGSATQASVVAYQNIYSGCSGTVPTVYWAYDTSNGLILTSPVISLDGTQVAFVQTSGARLGALILLKWKASTTETVSRPVQPELVTAANYRACTAPCMTRIFLRDGSNVAFNNTTSSMFYDYAGDVGWVGGQTGWLVKLTGLFNGNPTEVTTGGFPKRLNPGNPNPLASPVYDPASGSVFVGDLGGFFYRVASSNGAVTRSAQLDFGTGLVESPIVDQTRGLVYAFASSDGSTACNGVACAAVYVLPTNFAAASSGIKTTAGQSVKFGTLPNPNPLYLGGLDNAYFNSAGGTGNMYVCGNTGSGPTLYRIPVTAGSLGPSVAVAALTPAGQNPPCSPVTDFPNPNIGVSKAELLFFSVQNQGRPCANQGCLMNFVSLPWTANTTFAQGQQILVLHGTNTAIETATTSGTSGGTQPAWSTGAGSTTADGTVIWTNQGPTSVNPQPHWTGNHTYAARARINDGTNIQVTAAGGVSGGAAPAWNTTIGGTTTDNGVTWINVGPWPNVGRTVTGGTGGINIDNIVTSVGGSQVYFFTLGNNACTTSGGTGGCAMQVSQSSLN